MSSVRLEHGDCREVMAGMDAESVDAIVTDPPYGLEFMGKDWDHGIPGVPFWQAALRAAKPGAHLLAFGGSRTFHRLACAIEDAGWEIRDCVMWVYGSGFPKSLDVSKAIDKAAGAEREVAGRKPDYAKFNSEGYGTSTVNVAGRAARDVAGMLTAPATDAARRWSGWGTALKPAWEPIIVARKPLAGTVAENVLKHGTGAINVDGCRVETDEQGASREHGGKVYDGVAEGYQRPNKSSYTHKTDWHMPPQGRWPANLIHDGSDEVVALMPESATARIEKPSDCDVAGSTSFNCMRGNRPARGYDGSGSAARFFKCCPYTEDDLCDASAAGESSILPSVDGGSAREAVAAGASRADAPNQQASPATAASTGGSSGCTPPPSPAPRVDAQASIDTTQTMPSHLRLSGSAPPAIGGSIRLESGRVLGNISQGSPRFAYQPKASKADRDEGLPPGQHSNHPTVKPTALMRYLCRLVTPPGGTILDPFMGSGSTGKAAVIEGFDFIGIEQDEGYVEIARARIDSVGRQLVLTKEGGE